MSLETKLAAFARKNGFRNKGALCVALVMTDKAKEGMPIDVESLLTDGGGQVRGLGKGAVQSVLSRHGITRTLAEEGGRTSRGSPKNTRTYVDFLNRLASEGGLDLHAVEVWWVERVIEFFAGKPFKFRLDTGISLRAAVRDLVSQAQFRQKEILGSRYESTMLQHLVGAKLEIVLGEGKVVHHSVSEADQAEGRAGDFLVGDVAIHVTTHPGEALIRKCTQNMDAGLRPLIVTTARGAILADGLAEQEGIGGRVDILDAEQMLATNILEWGKFSTRAGALQTQQLVDRYNALIDAYETDPGLKIEVAGSFAPRPTSA